MKLSVPSLLTFNGGYTDTAGFLALQGLFTAHVTGNFVTLAASLILGTSGVLAKVLALPVFCVMVGVTRLFTNVVGREGRFAFNVLIGVKISFFVLAAGLALRFGPFKNGDATAAVVTGMALVAGMAIQNAVHRIFFGAAPPTTLMTGSTTQIMMDLADLAKSRLPVEARASARARCARLLQSVVVFAVGCAGAALIYAKLDRMVLLVPPIISAVAFLPHLTSSKTPGN
jgi:uncharacterized membrane protein YoaK (UPF0700 family)